MVFENMSVFEQARWYALIEAVNVIGDECDKRGKSFNKMKISPLDLEKYIEGTCDIYARKIETENATEIASSAIRKLHINLKSLTSVLQEA
jgi:hypothetical protein